MPHLLHSERDFNMQIKAVSLLKSVEKQHDLRKHDWHYSELQYKLGAITDNMLLSCEKKSVKKTIKEGTGVRESDNMDVCEYLCMFVCGRVCHVCMS